MQKRYIFLLCLLSLLLPPVLAGAADVPSSAEPSRVQPQIPPPITIPPSVGAAEAEPAAVVEAPAGADKIKFVFETVAVEGMTVYKNADIVPLYLPMVGREVSLSDVYALAEKMSAKYRNEGYVLSQVIVPPQTIDTGDIKLQAVEGFIDHVVIQSGDVRDQAQLAPYAAAIKASRPLKQGVLEKYMLLVNDLPGFKATSVLSPSPDTPGASDLTIEVEHKKYDASAAVDNRGTRYMGPLQFSAGAQMNSFLGLRERLNVQLATASNGRVRHEMDYASVGITQAVGHEGTTVTVNGSVTSTEPGHLLRPLGVKGVAHTYNVEVMHPFIRSRLENFYSTLKLVYLDSERNDNLGLGKTEDRMRVVRLASTYQFSDRHDGLNTLTAEISKGLNIFNAKPQGSPNMTRANGDPEFFKITGEASRVQTLTEKIDLFASVAGQWSADPLLASEEFGVGGGAYGSAYNSSEITGKNGLAARLELRANNPITTHLQFFQLYGFYDIGQVWDPDNATAADRIRALASTGIGIRELVDDILSCSVELAVPLTRIVETERNTKPRLFFAVMAKF